MIVLFLAKRASAARALHYWASEKRCGSKGSSSSSSVAQCACGGAVAAAAAAMRAHFVVAATAVLQHSCLGTL